MDDVKWCHQYQSFPDRLMFGCNIHFVTFIAMSRGRNNYDTTFTPSFLAYFLFSSFSFLCVKGTKTSKVFGADKKPPLLSFVKIEK